MTSYFSVIDDVHVINAISTAPTIVNTDKYKEIEREKPHTFIGREVN